METVWKFEPGPITSSTIVNISTIFEFRSLIYASLGLPIFDEVAKTLAASFESRCRHLYGPDAFRTTNKYNIHQTPTPS
jgi:ribosome-associated toxin RatA of RatAB toxin-antitoxin module